MTIILLDSGPVGRLIHPRADITAPANEWLLAMTERGHLVHLPDIIDYEVRRDLVRQGRIRSIVRLGRLRSRVGRVPVTSSMLMQAAEYWAIARRMGRQTADDLHIDIDMILAATATTLRQGEPVVVATDNVRHLGMFCDARPWEAIG